MRHFFACLLVSFVVSGCYLSHERPVPVILTRDSGPIVRDAGPVLVADAGSDASDGGSVMPDAGPDTGSDADVWIPCDPDVGPGGLLVLEDDAAFHPYRTQIVALPGLRHLMDRRILENPWEEDVFIHSFPVTHYQTLGRFYRNVTVEQDGRVLGRFETLNDGETWLVLDQPIRVPARSRTTFSIWSEIVGLESWVAQPSPEAALHSGDYVVIMWNGTGFLDGFGLYSGEAVGERSGAPYALCSDLPHIYGSLLQVVRASWIEIETEERLYEVVTDASDIEVVYFDANAFGGSGGLKRLGFGIGISGEITLRDAWVEIDGRRLTPDEARLDFVASPPSESVDYCLVTLRDEVVFDAAPGARSDSVRFALHVSAEGFDPGEAIGGFLTSSAYGWTDPVTGYLTEDAVSYTADTGRIIPGPGIEYSYGPRAGDVVGAAWIWSDHSEPDHVDEIRGHAGARDWIDAWLLNTAYVSHSHVR